MYALTVVFGPNGTAWSFMFESEASAIAGETTLSGEQRITDDFGQTAHFHGAHIHGVLLEDLSKSALAHVERGLHQARTQAKAQERARQDPVLQQAQRHANMSVLQPMGPGPSNGLFRS